MYEIKGDTVYFYFEFNNVLTEDILNKISKYPKFNLSGDFNQPIDNLPQGLKELKLGFYFNHPIDNLPQGLKKLDIRGKFNQSVDFLPQGLEELLISNYRYSHDLLNLPNTLKKIAISKYYKGQIVLPPNCEKIEI